MINTEKYVKVISSQTEKPKMAESVGVEINNQDITITENGVYTADAGYTGIGTATVNVPQIQPVIESLSITPTTSEQTITASGGTDGYSPITVSAVTSSIDDNIQPENIKSGVDILGVSGTMVVPPDFYIEKYNNNGILENRYVINNLTGITTIGLNALAYAFRNVPHSVTIPDFSNITTINENGLYAAFRGVVSKNGESVSGVLDLRNVTTVSTYGLYMVADDARYITGIDLRSLQTINEPYALYEMAYSSSSGVDSLCGVTTINLSSLKNVSGIFAMAWLAGDSNNLTSIDLSNLESLSDYCVMDGAFSRTTKLKTLNLSKLKQVLEGVGSGSNYGYSMAYLCQYSNIETVDMSSLEKITSRYGFYQSFWQATHLTNVDLSKLCAITGSNTMNQCFGGATALTSMSFDSLKFANNNTIMSIMFQGCTGLQNIYFKALNSRDISTGFCSNTFLSSVTGCTIHFPKNLDPQSGSTVVSSLSGYPNFGGTNTVLAFDQPSTNLLTGANSMVFERNPKYDTATALAWRIQDTGTAPNYTIIWTPCYTLTTDDPQVGDLIYGDEGGQLVITTISSIA